jgi:murein DD-endopeptidase MepM/ murein hydrolase activator NlpD
MKTSYWALTPLAALFALSCATSTSAVRPAETSIPNLYDESSVSRRQLLSNYLAETDSIRAESFKDVLDKNKPEGLESVILRCPLNDGEFTVGSKFGRRFHPILHVWKNHDGVDLKASTGTPVHAAYDGTVIFIGRDGGYGRKVVIEHKEGFRTTYSHLSSYGDIRIGKQIETGYVIGEVGQSGLATGPHAHVEVIDANGKPVNPLNYMSIGHTEVASK